MDIRPSLAWTFISFRSHLLRCSSLGLCSTFAIHLAALPCALLPQTNTPAPHAWNSLQPTDFYLSCRAHLRIMFPRRAPDLVVPAWPCQNIRLTVVAVSLFICPTCPRHPLPLAQDHRTPRYFDFTSLLSEKNTCYVSKLMEGRKEDRKEGRKKWPT